MTAVDHIELQQLSPVSCPTSVSEEITATTQDGRHTKSSSQKVRRSYFSLAGIAILLTILTPRSKLWMSSSSCSSLQQGNSTALHDRLDNSSAGTLGESSSSTKQQQQNNDIGSCIYYGSLNTQILILPTLWIIALIFSFLHLQGSNPGVLTQEVMERLDVDGGENNCVEDEHNAMENNDDLERRTFLESPAIPSQFSSPLDLTTKSENNISQNKHHSNTLYRSTRRKYCDKCQFHPPLRSHHCSTCNACIATFDHHCHFLGTCIGEKNHWRFWWFLNLNAGALKISLDIVNSSSLTLRAFVYGQDSSVSSSSDDLQLGLGTAINIIAKLYIYPTLFIATLLLIIHTLLPIVNGTTFEFTKGKRIDYLRGTRMMDFPFGRDGLCKNMIMFFRRDDVYRSLCLRSKSNVDCDEREMSMDDRWVPIVWRMPEFIDRESAEWWHHPMENKYWQCC